MTGTAQAEADKTTVPLQLAPGSYDLEEIEAACKTIAKAKPEDQEGVMHAELGKVRQADYEIGTAGQLPGHEFVERERVLVEGTKQPVLDGRKGETEIVGRVAVTENIQVFKESKAEEEAAATEEATVGATAQAQEAQPDKG
jgi:hypothetical protein